jgi:hypothetical protein
MENLLELSSLCQFFKNLSKMNSSVGARAIGAGVKPKRRGSLQLWLHLHNTGENAAFIKSESIFCIYLVALFVRINPLTG